MMERVRERQSSNKIVRERDKHTHTIRERNREREMLDVQYHVNLLHLKVVFISMEIQVCCVVAGAGSAFLLHVATCPHPTVCKFL